MLSIPEIKELVLNCLPEYWHYVIKDIEIGVYTSDKFLHLENEYIAIRCKYNNLGKVFIGENSYLARSSAIYGVWQEKECSTLEEAVEYAVKHSIR